MCKTPFRHGKPCHLPIKKKGGQLSAMPTEVVAKIHHFLKLDSYELLSGYSFTVGIRGLSAVIFIYLKFSHTTIALTSAAPFPSSSALHAPIVAPAV